VGDNDTPPDTSRLTVPEAAGQLAISQEAVRNRLSRGALRSVKENGSVYVLLEGDRPRHTGDRSTDRLPDMVRELLEEMRVRVEDLQKKLEQANERDRENRRIIAASTQRIPELEAPPQSGSEAPPAQAGAEPWTSTVGPQEGAEKPRSWWRRVFGG
jgi:hypothetical protein